jgi:hypothetical protein
MLHLAPRSDLDWSEEEMKEIFRLREACDAIAYCRLECVHSEEGDPWCVLYDQRDESGILDISRIDRKYILALHADGRSLSVASMARATDLALQHMLP